MSAKPRWTEAERAVIATHYKRRGPQWIARRINRSATAVTKAAADLGLCRKKWTDAEDATLVREWGEVCPRVLMGKLPGRSWAAIRQRAAKVLGLETGVPQGSVSIEEAARRLGYESGSFVLRLAARTGVTIRKHPRPRDTGPRVAGRRIVEWDSIRDAFTTEQRETESVAGAARTRGLCNIRLWRWLRAAGVLPELQPGAAKRGAMHLPSEVIDAVVAARRPASVPRELLSVAAVRLSLRPATLSRWLRLEGVRLGKGNKDGVPTEMIDRVVAAHRRAA